MRTQYTEQDLDEINNLLHDSSIDLETILFRNNKLRFEVECADRKSEMNVRGRFIKKFDVPVYRKNVEINNVSEYVLEDNAEIGILLISLVGYENGQLTIESSLPVKIICSTNELKIEVKTNAKLVGTKKISSFFGIESEGITKKN